MEDAEQIADAPHAPQAMDVSDFTAPQEDAMPPMTRNAPGEASNEIAQPREVPDVPQDQAYNEATKTSQEIVVLMDGAGDETTS